MDGEFKAYDEQGWPLCDFCPNRAVEAEALMRMLGGSTGNYPPVGRCSDHRRTSTAANHVSSAITPQMRRAPKRQSRAISAQYTQACPTCGAQGAVIDTDPNTTTPRKDGEPCRAKSGRVTDTHRARIDAQYA